MEFRQLRYFVGVAEALHFSKAAETLFVSQSALSQQILLLENELGVELFKRNKRAKEKKVELTDAGTVFLIEAKKLLQMSQKAVENVRRIGLHKEVIRFGIFKTSLKERLELIGLFKTHFADIDLKIIELTYYSDVQKALVDENIDIGFTFLPVKHKELSVKVYKKDYLSILLPKNHRLANEPFLKLIDLKDEKWIEVIKPINFALEQIEKACEDAGFSRENSIVQFVTGLELMNALVSMGIGIAIVPSIISIGQNDNLVLKPIVNADNTPFTAVEVSVGVAYKTEYAHPLILALIGLF